MTDSEQDRIIGSDFRTKRNAERNLACLESKRASIKRNIDLMLRIFDADIVVDHASENTLHAHDGAATDRKHQSIVVPTAKEILDLINEIEETQREISEIEQRLARA